MLDGGRQNNDFSEAMARKYWKKVLNPRFSYTGIELNRN